MSEWPEPKKCIVDFATYCPKCQFEKRPEEKDPCHKCLGQGWNVDSKKPIMYKERENYDKNTQSVVS